MSQSKLDKPIIDDPIFATINQMLRWFRFRSHSAAKDGADGDWRWIGGLRPRANPPYALLQIILLAMYLIAVID